MGLEALLHSLTLKARFYERVYLEGEEWKQHTLNYHIPETVSIIQQ